MFNEFRTDTNTMTSAATYRVYYHPPYDTVVTVMTFPVLYAGPWPQPAELDPFDERRSPKAWARWFREFLEELLGLPVYIPREMKCRFREVYIPTVCRSWLQFREWKMKTWKQRFSL